MIWRSCRVERLALRLVGLGGCLVDQLVDGRIGVLRGVDRRTGLEHERVEVVGRVRRGTYLGARGDPRAHRARVRRAPRQPAPRGGAAARRAGRRRHGRRRSGTCGAGGLRDPPGHRGAARRLCRDAGDVGAAGRDQPHRLRLPHGDQLRVCRASTPAAASTISATRERPADRRVAHQGARPLFHDRHFDAAALPDSSGGAPDDLHRRRRHIRTNALAHAAIAAAIAAATGGSQRRRGPPGGGRIPSIARAGLATAPHEPAATLGEHPTAHLAVSRPTTWSCRFRETITTSGDRRTVGRAAVALRARPVC